MFVSTRAATGVEILSGPASVFGLLSSGFCTFANPFGRLVEQPEPDVTVFSDTLATRWNNSNHITGCYPINVVAGLNLVHIRNRLWQSDLEFRCNFSHILTIKDGIL